MLSVSADHTRTMKEVAALANGSLTRLSRTVDRLDKQGWVTRRPHPDGRVTLAVLTEKGWQKVVATAPGHVAEVRRLAFDPLTKAQVRQLREIVSRIGRVVQTDYSFPVHPTPATDQSHQRCRQLLAGAGPSRAGVAGFIKMCTYFPVHAGPGRSSKR